VVPEEKLKGWDVGEIKRRFHILADEEGCIESHISTLNTK
jgi:hypothetical protein